MDKRDVEQWWEWFDKSAAELKGLDREVSQRLIDDHLSSLHQSLNAELANGRGCHRVLFRAADPGLRDLVETVLVACRTIEGWEFQGWRPARSLERELTLSDGFELPMESVTCEIARSAEHPWLEVSLAAPQLGPLDAARRQAGVEVLEQVLGERLREEAVESLSVRAEPAAPLSLASLRANVERELSVLSHSTGKPQWMMVAR